MPTEPSKPSKPAPANAALDDALFVPRLDRLALTEDVVPDAGPSYGDIMETICGTTDDSQPVEQYDGTLGVTTAFVAAHEHPVAQVQWNDNLGAVYTNPGDVNGVRWGSGTMIGPDLFLTAGHLFDQSPNGWTIPRQNGTNAAISSQEAATNMHLNFEYQVDPSGTLRAEQRFPIVALLEYRLAGVDFALCRIGGSPGNTYGWTAFALADTTVGSMLAIIGHPAGHPKRIEAGPATDLANGHLSYNDIDTLGGNSGSGILESPSGHLVGVHTNGGCNAAGTGSNFGSSIGAVLAASPTLRSLTPSTHTRFGDDHVVTALAADHLGTINAQDFVTINALDHLTTLNALDHLTTAASLDLATWAGGDVGTVGAGDDPTNTLVENAGTLIENLGTLAEGIGDPGGILTNPAVLGGRYAARPFVQAGPTVTAPGEALGPQITQVAAELQAVIVALGAVLVSLQGVHAALAGQP